MIVLHAMPNQRRAGKKLIAAGWMTTAEIRQWKKALDLSGFPDRLSWTLHHIKLDLIGKTPVQPKAKPSRRNAA